MNKELVTHKVLVVDDEIDVLEIISYNLKQAGFMVMVANNGEEALEKVDEFEPDLILMDMMMPKVDGIAACQALRKVPRYEDILIVFLSARGEEYSQLAAYDAGANDYITKPIKPKILIRKINALLELVESKKKKDEIISIGNLKIDKVKYKVYQSDKPLVLPRKEFELLYYLASEPGRVFTREEILQEVWGDDVIVGGRTIDVHIRKIREKLDKKHIKTIKGVGYKFE